jgi:hemerythrin-like metal-binding protein
MSVGNKIIDAEHEKIFSLVNKVEHAFRTRETDALSRLFVQFEETVAIHFNNQARIADAINHPFEEHHLEHQYVLSEFQAIKTDLLSRNGSWSESAAEYYCSFLCEWATAHIGMDDMKLKAKLENYPYDFIPPDTPN